MYQSGSEPRSWILRSDVWGRMNVAERREHCYNVNAYFRSLHRRNLGQPPDDVDDRLNAETEMNDKFRTDPWIIAA